MSKCTICLIDINEKVFGTYCYMGCGPDNDLGHLVCQGCRDFFDILEDNPTHCRMCPGMKPAVGKAWDCFAQSDNLYCFDCLIRTSSNDNEIKKLHDVFGK